MRSYVAQKKDIKTLLDNPKITFVLGRDPLSITNSVCRWSRIRQGHSVCKTRRGIRLHAHLRRRPHAP